jgi:PAS domain S-box-containing protein
MNKSRIGMHKRPRVLKLPMRNNGHITKSSKTNEKWLAALNAISGLITQSLDIRQVLGLAANKTIEVMDVDAILIFILNEKAQELSLEISKGVSEGFIAGVSRMKVGEGFNGTVAQTGRPLLVEDATTNPLLSRLEVVTEGIRSQLVVPLQSSGKVVGTLCVARRTLANFNIDEVALLSSVGNAIGAAVGNAYLHQEMKQTLMQLQQSEERYRSLFEKAYDAIWVHDLDGNALATNKACEILTGYSSEELMKKNICQRMPENSRSDIKVIEERLLHNQPVDPCCEGEISKKVKGKAIFHVTTSLITQDGKPVGFQHCARDVTDERQLQENLHYYLQQVTRAQEEERKRIARELHDDILQRLIAMSRQLEKITSSDALWEESLPTVRTFKKQTELAIQEMRRFARDLRPSILDDLGLLPAIDLLSDELEQRGIVTDFKVIGEAKRLSPEVEVMLFRIAQEALANIWRHAQASLAELVIEFSDTVVKLSIKDNGKGFNTPLKPGNMANSGKLGLAGMHERAKLLGGSLKLQSGPGRGTIITVEVPA